MGQSDAFAQNAETLGVDLGLVDTAVLSHGHFDHGGGLARFLALNDKAPVYISRFAFGPYYGEEGRYIGLDASLEKIPRLVPVGDEMTIDDELSLFTRNASPRPFSADSRGLYELQDGKPQTDVFAHEQYLLIREGARRVLVSGCAHKGVLNLMHWCRPDVLIGGFHLMNIDAIGEESRTLDQIADALNAYPATYYTCHCTGAAQYDALKTRMGEKLHYLAGGRQICV